MTLKNSRSDAPSSLASLDPHNPHLDVAVESCLTLRYLNAMTAEIYASSQNHIRSALEERGVDFEGRGLPVSLRPTVIKRAHGG